ncbi:MAG: hypothetical protein FWF60_00745 [Oscillospiraceae bacterium]|nr:hypothetical protein [Oscillospiraceae bacterium]
MTALLSNFTSLCEERQALIVSCENRCEHRASNPDRNLVRHFQIDGIVLKDGIKCDFLLLNDEKKSAYYIELKGSDILHAISQVEETARRLGQQLCGYTQLYRIVYGSGTHALQTRRVTEWKAKNRRKEKIKLRELKEVI